MGPHFVARSFSNDRTFFEPVQRAARESNPAGDRRYLASGALPAKNIRWSPPFADTNESFASVPKGSSLRGEP